ncbi:MAG: prenyltransferase, partial [Nocardioides sp.]
MRPDAPAVDGVLSVAEVEQTAASIAAMQEPDGAVPWTVGEHTDVWNHIESAMALLVGGQVEASDRAFEWCLEHQRADGS